MKEKTILIVDDTITNLDILEELLVHYDLIDATNGEDAVDIAYNEHIDLILLDIMMPNMDGYEVCKKLKSDQKTKNIPIIFITAKTDEESIEKAFDIGGADYITKPFMPKELLARVKKELHIQNLQSELKLLAATDPMTKLYNRRYFTQTAKHIFDLSKREKENLSLIMIDIDKFKNINDTYGHDVGDKVIVSLADALIQEHRESDIVCRFGGEEFVMLLPNTSLDNAQILANNIRVGIENLTLQIEDNEIKFTISLGISQIDLSSEVNIEAGLKRADEALYEAKNSGRNRVCTEKRR